MRNNAHTFSAYMDRTKLTVYVLMHCIIKLLLTEHDNLLLLNIIKKDESDHEWVFYLRFIFGSVETILVAFTIVLHNFLYIKFKQVVLKIFH
jgi:hypothetical protein